MDTTIKAYAALGIKEDLKPFSFSRREPLSHDILINILFCGICHSDIHQVNDDWGGGIFPMVPGHEIVGVVAAIGDKVSKFKVGEHVGVGCFVDSCRVCIHCKNHLEQYCDEGMTTTYNDRERNGVTPTYGGYSEKIVVNEDYVLRIPKNLPSDRAAPLLCAGITTYSPLKHWQVGKGTKMGVIGFGGLGHIAVKIAHHLGAEVTVFSHSLDKKDDAFKCGANDFIHTAGVQFNSKIQASFDFMLHTSSDLNQTGPLLSLLKVDGTMVLIGLPKDAPIIDTKQLILQRRTLAGSLIGGMQETQEMLDFCGKHQILADIELINIQEVNSAYRRILNSDIRYRFVINMASLD